MSNYVKKLVSAIASKNNEYRDSSTKIQKKLEALWDIGDQLVSAGVIKPHTVGWAIQSETHGLIKRSTIIRSYKIRLIWTFKGTLLKELGPIKLLSNLFDVFPLIDPTQVVRKQLSNQQMREIYHHMQHDSAKRFRMYIKNIKRKYSHGHLGRPLDRSRHLKEFDSTINELRRLVSYFIKIINQEGTTERNKFRRETLGEELKAFSNMCISLTTKENLRLFKEIGPNDSQSENQEFKYLYNYFNDILHKVSDRERARLRRLVSPEIFAQISDMVASLISEKAVKDFQARQKIVINL